MPASLLWSSWEHASGMSGTKYLFSRWFLNESLLPSFRRDSSYTCDSLYSVNIQKMWGCSLWGSTGTLGKQMIC
jgi:hypothetical protein